MLSVIRRMGGRNARDALNSVAWLKWLEDGL
jgi:hypothetical protein